MTYAETLGYLYQQMPNFQRQGAVALKEFSLSTTEQLMAALGNPETQFKSVHVAGTNGKGSSCHLIAAVLQAAGYRVGLYTSPHLKSFTERIRINGEEISQASVVDFVERSRPAIEELKPSFFEVTVAMAFDHFASQKVDIAIVEVGMGGRLDSTNVITPLVSLITQIGLDHQQWLGETLPKIAREKAGIMKHGIPTIVSQYQADVIEVFVKVGEEVSSPLMVAPAQWLVYRTPAGKFTIYRHGEMYLQEICLGLHGHYQQENLPGVLAVLEQLEAEDFWIGQEHVVQGFAEVVALTGLKGRWQILGEEPLTVADTGHNEPGLRAVLSQIQATPHRQLHWVWGMVGDKDAQSILSLLPRDANYYFCAPKIPRAMEVGALGALAKSLGLEGVSLSTVNEALTQARAQAAPDDLIMIGGSTFVVAELDEL
ncbi:MAG TPA: dihydrofolate synthase [Cytophagales bacterium]|nr:dihydrofolate synthase [Cytophagales bacterium]HAA23475.1 dihydrofolate synthase [Cytophagales bacterium]HAP58308.1 dihydrofolate synthase [Cytophagales bacterium]